MENHHLRMFIAIKIVSRVVRPPRLILRIPTDPKTSAKTNFEFQRRSKFFLAHFKSNLHVFKRATFGISEAIFMQKVPKVALLKTWWLDLKRARKYLKHVWNSKFAFADVFGSVGIRGNKRGGRTMRETIFIAINMRRWRFSMFWSCFKSFCNNYAEIACKKLSFSKQQGQCSDAWKKFENDFTIQIFFWNTSSSP